jgi:cytidine deaminase
MIDKIREETGACFSDRMLLQLARDLRNVAYAPYSCFTVGAACRAESGVTYFGCNVENSSYPVGICAERAAVAAAIAHGEKRITTIALAGGPSGQPPSGNIRPCGMCLQFLSEFMDPEGIIIIADGVDSSTQFTLKALLPEAFRLEDSVNG